MGKPVTWHRWYDSAAWRKRARHQLRLQPICAMCEAEGRITAASVVDHVQPHRGDKNAFRLGQLQSLCKPHHDSAKKRDEIRGYSTQVGPDGLPIDPLHPYNRGYNPSSANGNKD